jgi:carotenoid 1,2-hydratase
VDARHRAAASLAIGKSTIGWEGDALVVRIDERTTPLGRPLRGTVRLHPEGLSGLEYAIDSERRHLWWPVAPLSRIEVNMNEPSVRFSGHGYHDANAGDVPLEATFRHWTWSRARQGQSALLTYDATTLDGAHSELAFALHHDGAVEPIDGAAHAPIGRSNWGLDRHVRVDQGFPARIVRSLEDGPFYSRALVETRLRGERVVAMHEVLAARRLKAWWVQHCIGYRMRRERFAF